METTTTQPVNTPAIPSTYDCATINDVFVVVMPHTDFGAIKDAVLDAMITLQMLADGRITTQYSAETIRREIANLRAICDMKYAFR